jgi:hypothetical protein
MQTNPNSTFLSLAAYDELKKWMDFRAMYGETITGQSWVMRDLWDTSVAKGRGMVSIPKKLSSGIKRMIEQATWAQGLRTQLENGKKRHPNQAIHSMRKWFKTRCELGGMKPLNIESLLSHSTGISDSYYRQTENDFLQDYLSVTNSLSITTIELSPDLKTELSIRDDAYAHLSDEVIGLRNEIQELMNSIKSR